LGASWSSVRRENLTGDFSLVPAGEFKDNPPPMRFVLLALLVAACSKTPAEPERTTPPASALPAPPPSAAAEVKGEIAWDAPPSWTSAPNPSPMRKATYKIARAAGDTEDAELTVSAASGGVEANVKRWSGQFGDAAPKTETRKVGGLVVTVVEIRGTFASGGGMMGGPSTPKDKFMLLGAVVDGGAQQHFFKMTGPEKTVSAARKDFDALVASLRSK